MAISDIEFHNLKAEVRLLRVMVKHLMALRSGDPMADSVALGTMIAHERELALVDGEAVPFDHAQTLFGAATHPR